MTAEVTIELKAINESVMTLMNYCDTVAQLSTLAELQEHLVSLADILK